jgi:hypothetical protein
LEFAQYYYTPGVNTYGLEFLLTECTSDFFDENPGGVVENFQTYNVSLCDGIDDKYLVNISNLDTFFAIFDVESTNGGNDILY